MGRIGNLRYSSAASGEALMCYDYDPETLLADYNYYQVSPLVNQIPITNSGSYLGEELFTSTTRKPPRMNNVYHRKIEAWNVPFASYRTYYRGGSMSNFPYYRWAFPVTTINTSFGHLRTVHAGASRRAWWSMQPRFAGEVEMLNFLFELKDFKDIAKHIIKPTVAYDKLSNMLRHRPRGGDPTQPAAEGWLVWHLAIKPLIKDLTAIHAQLATLVREAQAEFKQQGSEMQSTHYSELLEQESYLTPFSKNNYYLSTGTYQKTLFTATMHYRYGYAMRSTIDAFVRYWGLEGTPEVFWNAIPFSFIADYFVGIGKSLHAMEIDRHVDLQMYEYAESLKTTLSTGIHVSPDDRTCAMVIDDELLVGTKSHYKLISGLQGTIYDRRLRTPNKGPALPKFKKPTGKQWTTMAAIVRCVL